MPDEKEIEDLLSILRDVNQPPAVRQQALEQLLAHNEEVQALLRKDFKTDKPVPEAIVSEAGQAYDRLRQQLHLVDQEPRPVQKTRGRMILYRWAGVAAAVLLCIGATWFFRQRDVTSTGITTVTPSTKSFITANQFDTIRNKGMSTTFHRLPDGSTVHLEAHSQLYFRDTFPAAKKEIFLKGSALFTVNKEEGRPFSVFVSGIEVLDLGTVFSITTKQSLVKIRLIQGKVMVRAANPQLLMQDIALVPGQEFGIDTSTRQYSVHFITPGRLVRENKLKRDIPFKNASLQEVFVTLARACNVSIHFNRTELKDMAFTGTFEAGSNARNNIAMICMINDLKYELRNNSIYIHR
jgi:transmembrane sensor